MTTAEYFAQYGFTLDQVRAGLISTGSVEGVFNAAKAYHITNEMLGDIFGVPASAIVNFFSGFGLDSTVLDPVVVSTVSSPTVAEGGTLGFVVTLSAMTTEALVVPVAIGAGSASLSDLSSYTVDGGVTIGAGGLHVPAGVTSFTFNLVTADDAAAESSETIVLGFGGVSGIGTITDNDTVAGAIVVNSVGASEAAEGGATASTITLSGMTTATTTYDIAITEGTAVYGDLGGITASNGVTVSATQVTVPAGVSSFVLHIEALDDTADENNETFTLTVGGHSGTQTILDNDTAPPSEVALIPEELAPLMNLISLDTSSGVLSVSYLREHIIAATNATDYNNLFSADGILGAADGTWTTADLGFSQLGNLPATEATVESLFYGTIIKTFQAIDVNEVTEISTFVTAHQAGLEANDPATIDALVTVMVGVFSDPAAFPIFDDTTISTTIITVGTAMVQASVGSDITAFDGLFGFFGV